jgi:hypothetical protein
MGAVYVSVQQDYREALNDPQIQIAEDAALKLSQGGTPAEVVPHEAAATVDIQKSLAPWVAVYDASGVPLESSGVYDGAPPKLPQGVFDVHTWSKAPMYTQNGMRESRFSWQPDEGIRQAVVLVHASNGMYVASGRNMRDVEQRIEHLGEIIFAAWVVTLGALLAASFIAGWVLRS